MKAPPKTGQNAAPGGISRLFPSGYATRLMRIGSSRDTHPKTGPKSGHEPAHLALRGTTRHYVAQECPLTSSGAPPLILAAPPALVLFDVWEDAENITGMGRELARHESDGKSAAKNGTKRGARRH